MEEITEHRIQQTRKSKQSPRAPSRFVKFQEDSIEFSMSRLSHKTKSIKSKSPSAAPRPSKADFEEKHKQLISQLDRLVKAQSNWQIEKLKLEVELKQCRAQNKKLKEQNVRMTRLMKEKDSLYEEMREQLHEQLNVIENLERQIQIPRYSLDNFGLEKKETQDNMLSSTFCTEKQEESRPWVPLRAQESSWTRLEQNIAKDLGSYIDIKISYDLLKKKLQQREEQIKMLKQYIIYLNEKKSEQHSAYDSLIGRVTYIDQY